MDSIPQQLLLQLFLIFLNAFFAMTEIAVISLSPVKLRRLADEGDKAAPRLLKLVEEPSGFLSTIQIGITLAGFLGSAFAADNFSEYLVTWLYDGLGFTVLPLATLDTLSVIVITLILSYFTLIFGELVPKRIAMQKPLQVARVACRVVSIVAVVMRPVVWFLSFSTNAVLRLLRLKTQADEETVTEEEIRMMLDLGEEKGTISSSEGAWIDNVFDFGGLTAYDAMTHTAQVKAIPLTASTGEILQLIRSTGLSRFPVYGKSIDDVVGILNAREFLLDQNSPAPSPLRALVRDAYFVPESVRASVLFQDMQKNKMHLAVVVDEYGQTSGVVTMEDLLEEIVGNIYDEFDPAEEEDIVPVADGVWRVSGTAELEALQKQLGVPLPLNAGYDTLNGMVLSRLRTIPPDGTPLDMTVNGLDVHVEALRGRRIVSALVKKAAPTA